MGKPPAIIVIARHGARLDAADAQWHLTTPTPYDSPLTYGGWTQAQALGAHLDNILHAREGSVQQNHGRSHEPRPAPKCRHRRHRVIIHSSPFLRCVQTSIAIAAGINQGTGHLDEEAHHADASRHRTYLGSVNNHLNEARMSPHLTPILEPEEDGGTKDINISLEEPRSGHRKPALLRLDPFLGEWLTPDYFENVTPPPTSKMMVAGAKAGLLRMVDPPDVVDRPESNVMGKFPGGWVDMNPSSVDEKKQHEPDSPDQFWKGKSPRPISRSKTHSSIHSGRASGGLSKSSLTGGDSGYAPPVPSHVLPPSQPIPRGYVTHAQDACIQVDYQWDSMRQPLDWGTGGDYGEEWSAMHRRFRRGLHEMVEFYRHRDSPEGQKELPTCLHNTASEPSCTDESSDEEFVLVIVTHGAGCNALIGALTNQPVLLDVGLASLTMAVRKSMDDSSGSSSVNPQIATSLPKRSSINSGTSDQYEMKLIASTEHLRPGKRFLDPPRRSRSPTLPMRERSPYRYERHVGSPSRHQDNRSPVKVFPFGSADRKSSGTFEEGQISGPQKQTVQPNVLSSGLWASPQGSKALSNTPKGAIPVAVPKITISKLTEEPRRDDERLDSPLPNGSVRERGQRIAAQHGLWGGSRSVVAKPETESSAFKRRWTMGQA